MEMKKRAIYAENLLTVLRDDPHINGANFARVKRHVNEMSTVDAVEVVRCKECKHMLRQRNGVRYCMAWHNWNALGDEGFCNYGERREGE